MDNATEKAADPTVGRFVQVNISYDQAPSVLRPALVLSVWENEYGPDEPAGVNVRVFLDGSNDEWILSKNLVAHGGSSEINAAAMAKELCAAGGWWLTSLRYGIGPRCWRWPLRV